MEPIPNPDVIDTGPLRDQSLAVKEAFAERSFECGVVDEVIDALTSSGAVTTIDGLNTSFDVAAGGFAGATNPAFVYIVVDSGPNAASTADIQTLTNSLGYVLSQGSAFLLDGDNPDAFDFPANYVVLNFDSTPTMEESAALFETVGEIDPDLFETDTSGYTQYGRAYLSLQSDVPDPQQFIDGYVQAAAAGRGRVHARRRRRPRAVHRRRCLPRQRLGSRTPRARPTWLASRRRATTSSCRDPRRPSADHTTTRCASSIAGRATATGSRGTSSTPSSGCAAATERAPTRARPWRTDERRCRAPSRDRSVPAAAPGRP